MYAWAQTRQSISRQRQRVDTYLKLVDRDSMWLVSRLQMYWTTHATKVYIRGEQFDHPGGGRAPYPTVKLNGARSTASQYNRPSLAQVVPYDDDAEGCVTFVSRATGQMEKAHPSKTGCNIAAINREILSIARDAALVYESTHLECYAQLALPVLDVFLRGLAYRDVPIDLAHGHQQTLVGMTTFEVIHEDAIREVTEAYQILRPLMADTAQQVYDRALCKWADNIIQNGVPHNNWNLIQAEFVAQIALTLLDNAAYADGHGRQYYLNSIVNHSSLRQWGLRRLADYGFDSGTAIWGESPGYSVMVVGDFCTLANRLDRDAGIDLFDSIPQLLRAVRALPQYLMPNRMIAGFGDTHPNYLPTRAFDEVTDYARRHGKQKILDEMADLRRLTRHDAPADSLFPHSALYRAEASVHDTLPPFVSPLFYAPNVSWLIQRTGMDVQHDLAVSLNASLGNHQHANGISMELYGRGYALGPDAGIGRTLYSGLDYAEYYSQFPAHNTVCVNGISSYPVMMSHHPFKVESSGYHGDSNGAVTFSQVSFLEPETQAQQLRTNAIVKTTPHGGYYIDIFRSRTNAAQGEPQFHDYFYHNMGQEMTLTQADGTILPLKPTEELSFAGGHLYAYSYIYDKFSAATERDVRACFRTYCPEGRTVDMNMWMMGSPDREVYKALSPPNLEYERLGSFMPYDVGRQPVLTYVARQQGDAWYHPFVAVFEPSSNDYPSDIASITFYRPKSTISSAFVIHVRHKSGRDDFIFSAPQPCTMEYSWMKVTGIFAVYTDGWLLLKR